MTTKREPVLPESTGWRELPRGAVILQAGNAEFYETGAWRTYKPIWHKDKCIQCLRCWIFCPDSSIVVSDGKVTGIDYQHCKGCGICEMECPEKVHAIDMVSESESAKGEGA